MSVNALETTCVSELRPTIPMVQSCPFLAALCYAKTVTLPEVFFAPSGIVHMMCALPVAGIVTLHIVLRCRLRLSGDEGFKAMREIVKDIIDAALVALLVIDAVVARSGAPFAFGEDPTVSEPVSERAETLLRIVVALLLTVSLAATVLDLRRATGPCSEPVEDESGQKSLWTPRSSARSLWRSLADE